MAWPWKKLPLAKNRKQGWRKCNRLEVKLACVVTVVTASCSQLTWAGWGAFIKSYDWVRITHDLQLTWKCGFSVERFRQSHYCSDVASLYPGWDVLMRFKKCRKFFSGYFHTKPKFRSALMISLLEIKVPVAVNYGEHQSKRLLYWCKRLGYSKYNYEVNNRGIGFKGKPRLFNLIPNGVYLINGVKLKATWNKIDSILHLIIDLSKVCNSAKFKPHQFC